MQPTFEGTLTQQDFIRAQTVHQPTLRFWHAWRISAAVCLGLMIAAALAIDIALLQRMLPIVLFLLFFIFFQWWTPRLQAANAWRTHKALQDPISGGVVADGLQYNGVGFKGELAWSMFLKYKHSADMILLYQSSNAFHMVPKSLFNTDDDWTTFLTIVKQHVPQTAPAEQKMNRPLWFLFIVLVMIVALLSFIMQLLKTTG